jgi:general secretion pathway protein G
MELQGGGNSAATPIRASGANHIQCDPRRRLHRATPASDRLHKLRGFTLLELLVVVVIIGLLAGLVAPRYFDQVGRSNTQIARAQINALEKALDQYRLDMGTYPTSDAGLQALVVKPDGAERWQGPYLKKAVPPDPWGRPYHYRGPGEHGDYDLFSFGADGQAGGTGENIDVASWELTAKASQ